MKATLCQVGARQHSALPAEWQVKQGCCILPWGHSCPDFMATAEKFHREKGGVFLQ